MIQAGELFLGGDYIELGISNVGSFGTTGSTPTDFYGTTGSSALGLSNDADGFDYGDDLRIDFFLLHPRREMESWVEWCSAGVI